jgi:hypothetical protein
VCDGYRQDGEIDQHQRLGWVSGVDERQQLEQRSHLFRRARLAVVALVIGYFFLPYDVQSWIPVWLPFAAALGLEVQFFLGGYLASTREHTDEATTPDRGPQERDLAELGWEPEPDADEEEGHEEVYEAPEYDERRPYMRHVAEAIVALAIVGGILFYAVRPHGWNAVSQANRARAAAVFSREAGGIAGHPAAIVCDTSFKHVGLVQDADGSAQVGGRVAYLLPSLCDELYQLKFKHRVHGSRTGRALAVLTHESWHLNGIANEGLANCYAFQSGFTVGVHLGLSESRARALMSEQLATNASDSAADSRYLVPPGCRDGGEYDLHPGSNAFP